MFISPSSIDKCRPLSHEFQCTQFPRISRGCVPIILFRGGGGDGAKEQCPEKIKLDETESAVTESRKGPEKTIQIC